MAVQAKPRDSSESLAPLGGVTLSLITRIVVIGLIDAVLFWLAFNLFVDGIWTVGIPIIVILLLLNVANFHPKLEPLRWQVPVLSVVILVVLFPVVFTIYSAFTNYSDGHILSKQQAIDRLQRDLYLPEEGRTLAYTAFRSEDGEFVLWLQNDAGEGLLATTGALYENPADSGLTVGELDSEGIPTSIEGYERLNNLSILQYLSDIQDLRFGVEGEAYAVRVGGVASQLQQRFVYDAEQDAMIDQRDEIAYFANGDTGFFESEAGENLLPGYTVQVGLAQFERLFGSPAFRGPFISIFIWTVMFAFLSVFLTFSVGLLLALAYDDPIIPARKVIRSLLILPWALPGIIGVLIWRGMLEPNFGIIGTLAFAPEFFNNPFWARFAVLLINTWLGYPYMMLVTSAALQTIPTDIYEAAEVDGAGPFQRFWNITLPLLLVAVGPLLIASFVFNFNNFTTIFAFNEGRPPIANTPTPAGHTDILISYTYRIAFEGGGGSDYAYAAAITIVIFIITAIFTLLQFQASRTWEEVSENV